MGMDNRHHVGSGLVNRRVNKTFPVRPPALRIDGIAVEVELHHVVGCHQPWGLVTRQQEVIASLISTDADMAETIARCQDTGKVT